MIIALTSFLLAYIPLGYLIFFRLDDFFASLKSVGYGVVIISSTEINSLIISSVILGLLPYSIVDLFNRRYLDAIDRDLGPFFKGLAESIRAGSPITKAIEHVATVTPGPLGKEMRKVAVWIQFGVSFPEALQRIGKKIKIPSMQRAITILITAYMSGGKVIDVLDAAAEMYSLLRGYEEEKRTHISPYSWISYISIGIFLFITFILIYAFFFPLSKLMAIGTAIGQMEIDVESYKSILYYTVALEAFFGGLIVGKLRVGSIYSGLKHSLILLLISMLFFTTIEMYGEQIQIFPTF